MWNVIYCMRFAFVSKRGNLFFLSLNTILFHSYHIVKKKKIHLNHFSSVWVFFFFNPGYSKSWGSTPGKSYLYWEAFYICFLCIDFPNSISLPDCALHPICWKYRSQSRWYYLLIDLYPSGFKKLLLITLEYRVSLPVDCPWILLHRLII